jgi:hypothetical protein
MVERDSHGALALMKQRFIDTLDQCPAGRIAFGGCGLPQLHDPLSLGVVVAVIKEPR